MSILALKTDLRIGTKVGRGTPTYLLLLQIKEGEEEWERRG